MNKTTIRIIQIVGGILCLALSFFAFLLTKSYLEGGRVSSVLNGISFLCLGLAFLLWPLRNHGVAALIVSGVFFWCIDGIYMLSIDRGSWVELTWEVIALSILIVRWRKAAAQQKAAASGPPPPPVSMEASP